MFVSKRQKEILESTESKLTRMFAEMNAEQRGDDGRLVCETRCTMARIRSYSDFLYLMRVKPLQTMCYYGAAVFFLLIIAAFWTKEWILGIMFVVIFLILATLPHNMRIRYFNKQADALEDSYGRLINADFGEKELTLTISEKPDEIPETDDDVKESTARRSAAVLDENAAKVVIPYERIYLAYECSHSFYIFPADEDKRRMDTIICDKTQFLCGTPMRLRDTLARNCGKKFKIKTKKA